MIVNQILEKLLTFQKKQAAAESSANKMDLKSSYILEKQLFFLQYCRSLSLKLKENVQKFLCYKFFPTKFDIIPALIQRFILLEIKVQHCLWNYF